MTSATGSLGWARVGVAVADGDDVGVAVGVVVGAAGVVVAVGSCCGAAVATGAVGVAPWGAWARPIAGAQATRRISARRCIAAENPQYPVRRRIDCRRPARGPTAKVSQKREAGERRAGGIP